MGTECQDPWAGLRLIPDAEALELRLADGRGPCEGRVEMKLQGRWGTVTDDTWDMDDAEVVCQQLGCGSAAGAYLASRFRSVEAPIMLAFIDCQGDEAALWDCKIRGWGPYKGPHDFDTAVVCQGERWAHAAIWGAHCPHPPAQQPTSPGRVLPAGRRGQRVLRKAGGAAGPDLGQRLPWPRGPHGRPGGLQGAGLWYCTGPTRGWAFWSSSTAVLGWRLQVQRHRAPPFCLHTAASSH